MKDRLPIYVHINKTGGTTYCTALMNAFDGPTRFSNMGLWTETTAKIKTLKQMSPRREGQLQVIFGHNTQEAHLFLNRPGAYFSTVREPFERLKSMYRQNCRYREKNGLPKPEIEAFITEYDRHLAHYFFSVEERRKGKAAAWSSQEWHDRAIERIDKQYVALGLTEAMDESIALFNHVFGWDIFKLLNLNVSNRKEVEVQDESTAHLEAVFHAKHPHDAELYRYIKERFTTDWNRIPNHEEKLAEFRSKRDAWAARQQQLDQLIPGHARLRKIAFEIRKMRY